MKEYTEYPASYREALNLLIPLWRGIPADYKRQYARNIWSQFEDNIRAAAYTASLSRFVNSICSRLQIRIGSDDTAAVNEVLMLGRDRELLRQIRDEAATLVLMVRLENDRCRDEWARLHAAGAPAAEEESRDTGGLFGIMEDE